MMWYMYSCFVVDDFGSPLAGLAAHLVFVEVDLLLKLLLLLLWRQVTEVLFRFFRLLQKYRR